MCGRFAMATTEAALKAHFDINVGCVFKPRYNISPQSPIPTVTEDREIRFFHWGFIPAWARAQNDTWPNAFINARIESIDEKPSFKQAFKQRRCIVPATGYYEWKLINGKKQPFFIYPAVPSLLGMGAIWETWRRPDGTLLETLAIVTQPATLELQGLHDRMPVLLTPASQNTWLDQATSITTLKSLTATHAVTMKYHPVPTSVNNPAFDEPACLHAL